MEPDSTPEPLEALPEDQLEELLEQPEEPKPKRGPGRPRKELQPEEPKPEPKPKRGPGRPRKTQPEELLEPEEPKRVPELPQKPKRGPGRPRKEEEPKRVELPQEPKRGPRPRKELKELKTEEKTPPSERSWEQLDPIAELTRLIKQRNEEQARQRKTAYATMLGL
jgi:hypothetical protein